MQYFYTHSFLSASVLLFSELRATSKARLPLINVDAGFTPKIRTSLPNLESLLTAFIICLYKRNYQRDCKKEGYYGKQRTKFTF